MYLNYAKFDLISYIDGRFMKVFALAVVAFVLFQSFFFLIKAWKQGKTIGMQTSDLKKTVTSSALFTIAPAIAILATVITLSSTLGLVVPWIKLTFIGNIQYEVTATETAIESYPGNVFGQPISDPTAFAAIVWVMTLGSILPLVLLPIFLKKIQSKVNSATNVSGGDGVLGDTVSAAAFLGLIGAFVGNALAGQGKYDETSKITTPGAGVMSVSVLATSIIVTAILEALCKKFKWDKFETFVMPIGMFAGMGVAILIHNFLPSGIAEYEWRPIVNV